MDYAPTTCNKCRIRVIQAFARGSSAARRRRGSDFEPLLLTAVDLSGDETVYFRATLDTGAKLNMISETIAGDVGRRAIRKDTDTLLTGLGNHDVKPLGTITLRFRQRSSNSNWYEEEFYVLRDKDLGDYNEAFLCGQFTKREQFLIKGPAWIGTQERARNPNFAEIVV